MHRKQYRSMTLLFLACAFFVLPRPSAAKTEVVYASYKYVMGDNDTKNDAKRLCFLEAKRRCLEKVGSYVESLTEVQEYELTKDEIRSYTSAIVKVEVVSEKIAFEGESVVINTRVKAEVDADHTRKELERIAKDKGLQARIKEQQNQIESLESKISRLQIELDSSSYQKSPQLIDKRRQTLGNLDAENERLRKIILAKRTRDNERVEIVASRKRNRRLVLQYVEIGMTVDEVRSIIKEIAGSDDLDLVEKDNPILKTKYQEFKWDGMRFVFAPDKYTDLVVLFYISYKCFGKDRTRRVHLKNECINILDFDLDGIVRKTRASKADLEKYLANSTKSNYGCKNLALNGLLYCPETIRAYLWGEE